MTKSLTSSELSLFNQLADFYHDSRIKFKEILNAQNRFTQQSFINWCQFEGLEKTALLTAKISQHKLFI